MSASGAREPCVHVALVDAYAARLADRSHERVTHHRGRDDAVLDRVLLHPEVRRIRAEVERQVREGELTPALAAQQLLNAAEVQ